MRLDKVKRPVGTSSFWFQGLDEDSDGVWLFAPVGSRWVTPHDSGTLPVDVVTLITPGRWFVSWWVDDAHDRRIEIDICLPPKETDDGWSYVDLELDVVQHELELVVVEDRDEFEVACGRGWITPAHAAIAQTTAAEMKTALEQRLEPWGDEGWRRVAEAKR